MTRYQRNTHANAFGREADFNEQLYAALRQSPWWMTSLAVHVLVFLILTLLDTTADAAPVERALIQVSSIVDDPLDEEPVEAPVNSDDAHESEIMTEEVILTEDPPEEFNEDDNDMDFNETFGNEGSSEAPYDGPSTSGDIGLGANAGSPFGRGRGGNKNGRKGSGAGKHFDDAVEDGLRWLAAHQSPNGGWESAGFANWCDGRPVSDASKRPDGAGKALHDPGVTGLALCAFLGAGYTNRGKHPFAKVVSRGLRYLKNIQDPEGCFGPRAAQQYIYSHATASLAMVEAYGMTGSVLFRNSAQRALDFISIARNPYFAWRYGLKPGDNDTSVSGWMMMALKSAQLVNKDAIQRGRRAPLVIDEGGFDGLRAWLNKVTDPDTGRVGYVTRGTGPARPEMMTDRFPADKSEAMTAVGILARAFMGEDPRKSKVIDLGAQLCKALPPTWNTTDGSIDMYYWYYATLAMFQVGGDAWKTWRKAMPAAMVDSQRKDGEFCQYKGSWDPIGPWGHEGGRVYSTAVMSMCLQVYYRYDLAFGRK